MRPPIDDTIASRQCSRRECNTQVTPIDWTPDEYASFGRIGQVNRHRYHESPSFSKAALARLLDDYPRRWLQAFTMGEDPCRADEWRCVDIAPDTSGEALWRAVERGRLWLNVTHVEEASPEIGALVEGMYAHLGERCPHLERPRAHYSTLLVSSPGAQVYYHLDAEPNMLWHLSGTKRLWLYPAMDLRFVPQSHLEDIYAGEVDENLPYDPAFDAEAEVFALRAGDVASWPHNGPHRIENVDVNVSLATSYRTPATYRREYVQLANRFVLRGLGVRHRRMDERGLRPALKRFAFRAANKVRPFPRIDRSASYVTDLQIDADATDGLRRLPQARPASFSRPANGA